MNKIIPSIFLLLFVFVSPIFGRELHLDIHIKNPTNDVLSFSYPQNALLGEEKVYKIPVKEDGKVYTIINVERYPFLKITYGETQFEAYVDKQDKLVFSFDATDILGTLQFQDSPENNILNDKQHQIQPLNATFTKNFITAKVNQEVLENAKKGASFSDFKKNYTEKPLFKDENLHPEVVKRINQRHKYSYLTNILTFFVVERKNWNENDYQKVALENHILEGFDLFDDALLNDEFYTNFLQCYLYFQQQKGFNTYSPRQFLSYEIASKQFTDETKDWMLCRILINAQKEKYTDLAQKKFFQLKRTSPYTRYIKTVEQLYGDELSFDPDGAAPNFTLKNANGENVSLSDFEGKVVYISFWASWCRPCLSNFTKTEGIRLQMMDRGVILINICLDSSESTWQRTMLRVPMPGVNLYASADTPLKLKYDLSRLPAYYIINKKGNFTYLPDGQRDILVEFEKLVNQ